MLIKNRTLTADIMILISALLWGGEYVVVKDALDFMPPNWINALRFILASIIMVPIFFRQIRSISKDEIRAGLLLGTFLFGGFCLQTVGIQYTTAGKSGFLTSTYVVMIPFITWRLKRKFPGIKAILSALICTAGFALLSLEGGLKFNSGDVMTIGAAVCFSGSILSFEYYSRKFEPINLTFVEMAVGGLLSLALAAATEKFPVDVSPGRVEIFQLLYLVILGSLACHILSNFAMRWSEAAHAAILWSLESVFAMVFGIIFLHEAITGRSIGGFILILFAVLLTELGGRPAD